jgi:TonB family protein
MNKEGLIMPAIFRPPLSAVLFFLASVSLAQTPLPTGQPYRVEGNVTRPEKISGSPPVYTIEARKARITGVVILEAIIDEQGNVTDVKVLQGLPMGLDQAALEAVKNWKFKPATLDGQPVKVYYTLTVNYTMETGPERGTLFAKFMEENPDFGALMRGKRYLEALAFLDERVGGPEVRLARAYVLAELHRIDQAWEEAQAYDGPEPYEILHHIAFATLNAAAGARDEKARAGFLEVGLQAATRAMAAREDARKTMIIKSHLLREKAKLTVDPQRAALLYEADELWKRAGASP